MKSYLGVLAVVLLAGAIPAHSQTLDDQERCASQARKAFDWENESKKSPGAKLMHTVSSDYESHFNTKMKKCLILIQSVTTIPSLDGNSSNTVTLMDAYERHVYAYYLWTSSPTKKYWEVKPMSCELIPAVQPKKNCADREEFDAFVAGYLEK
jgi:hypothetical protein